MTNAQIQGLNAQADESELCATEYSIYPLAEALFFGVVVFLAIFLTTYFIYHHALNAQKGEIKQGLVRTGAVLAAFVDGDMQKLFVSRDQETSDLYKSALIPFRKTLDADPSIAFVYTAILRDDKVYFILDPTPEGDANHDGVDDKSHIMQEYTDASVAIQQALKEQKVVTSDEPYKDQWGSFVSSYTPLYDAQNKFVGVVGIDVHADTYFERLAPIKRATIRAMVTGFFISFLIAATVWFTRNFSKVINRSRRSIYIEYERIKARL